MLIHELVSWLQLHWGSGRLLVDGSPAKPIKFSPIQWCLGRLVDVDEDLGIVMVSGQQYINDMEKKYMTPEAAALVSKFKADIPTEEGISKLSTTAIRQSPDAASLTRSLVQSLAYCGNKFKHEIMFYVGRLQRFADNPCADVYRFALQVLKYCIRDKVYGIAWSRCNEESELELSVRSEEVLVSVDSSWQVHDKSTRSRSTTGMVFFWHNGPVSVRCNEGSGSRDRGVTDLLFEHIVCSDELGCLCGLGRRPVPSGRHFASVMRSFLASFSGCRCLPPPLGNAVFACSAARPMSSQQAKKMRPSRPSGQSSVRLDGDMLLFMHGATDKQLVVTPTATIDDYGPADETMVGHNTNMLEARDLALGAGKWDGGCGVWRLELDNHDGLALSAYQEFRDRFRDGVLTLQAPQEQDPMSIQGGWLKPYQNTLSRDQADQQKSVLAIHAKSFPKVKKSMPFLNEVVDRVKKVLLKEFRTEGRTNLKPVEYTFFCGTYSASCTKFHQDTAEHPDDTLVFTTLTLLTVGSTSMCIAGKEETWLCKPFDTICFDPDLFHRSGETYEHIVKLSIHWRELSKAVPKADATAKETAVEEEKEPVVKREKMEAAETGESEGEAEAGAAAMAEEGP